VSGDNGAEIGSWKSWARRVISKQDELTQEMRELRREHGERMEALQHAHTESLNALRVEHAASFDAMRQTHVVELEKLRLELRTDLGKLRDKVNATANELWMIKGKVVAYGVAAGIVVTVLIKIFVK